MGIYDDGEEKFLKSFLVKLNKNPIIFDVGANIGNYSKLVTKIRPDAKIIAFEPNKSAFCELKKLASNKIITLNFGLSKNKTKAVLYNQNDESNEHASIYAAVITSLHKKESTKETIHLDTIDNICKQMHIETIDFLKIDTEGNELAVLQGALGMLKKQKIAAIQFEFNEMNVISHVFFKDFIDLLNNYNFFRITSFGLIPITYSPLKCEIFAYQNILAIKK